VLRVRTKADLSASPAAAGEVPASVVAPDGTAAVRRVLRERAEALARPSAAPAESRCRHHVEAAAAALRRAAAHAAAGEPAELLALELRTALDQIGETAGAVYTDDLLDRVFSRFCIGK
jgi:tRNA modification GTPase